MERRVDIIYNEDKTERNNKRFSVKPYWRQVYIVSAAWNIGFLIGMSIGTNTVAIPQMKKESIEVSEDMRSWLGSIFGFGSLAWLLFITPMVNYCGVKKTYIFIYLAPFFGSILSITANSSIQLLCGQAIQSIMLTSMTNVSIMVLTDYVTPENRSFLFTIKSASINWGIWVANAIGTFSNWRYIPATSIFCSLYGISIFFWPESPFWLANRGRIDECIHSFRWSRGIKQNTEEELKKLIEDQCYKTDRSNKDTSLKNLLNGIKTKQFWMPMFIVLIGNLLYYANGKLACTMYAVELFDKIAPNSTWVYSIMLVLDGFSVFGMYCGCYLANKYNRRLLLLGGSCIGIICLYLLSLQSFLVKHNIMNQIAIISFILFIVFTIAICIGPLVLLAAIGGELVPLNHRLLFCNLYAVFNALCLGFIMKISPYFFKLGHEYTFLFYAALCTVSVIILFKYLPETKGKTQLEITQYFQKDVTVNKKQTKLLTRNEMLIGD